MTDLSLKLDIVSIISNLLATILLLDLFDATQPGSEEEEQWRISRLTVSRSSQQTGSLSCESLTWTSRSCIALAGGGGAGGHGIPNVIVICRADLETNSLSEQPVGGVVVTCLPYRMAASLMLKRLYLRCGSFTPLLNVKALLPCGSFLLKHVVLDLKKPHRQASRKLGFGNVPETMVVVLKYSSTSLPKF
ncbi:Uncharacterized protein Rs2_21546 [Raphanus sativus]|nr:Uncharacterized protein Rs2_21546 [Raphanus sativus]